MCQQHHTGMREFREDLRDTSISIKPVLFGQRTAWSVSGKRLVDSNVYRNTTAILMCLAM